MKIGEVAKRTGVSLRTIRYYEELELIQPRSRSRGGFRLYDDEVLARIRFIQSLQELQLSLKDIKSLLVLKDDHKTRGALARTLLAELVSHCAKAETKRSIYQAIVKDLDEGIRILNECRECTRPCHEPHCGRHEVFLSEKSLPIVLRSLF